MNYLSFTSEILSRIREYLPDGCEADIRKIEKNNGVEYIGIYLKRDTPEGASPLVYAEPYYQNYENGTDLDAIAAEIAAILIRPVPADICANRFLDTDFLRKNIIFRLVNRERNAALLPELIHRDFMDLVVTYGIVMNSAAAGSGIVLVRKSMAAEWDITEQEMFELAMQNTPRIMGEDLKSMSEMLGRAAEPVEDGMYVLSNSEAFYGASVMLYTRLLKLLAENLACDLYILPSSVHELIITPGESENEEFLKKLVREVNELEVSREEVLSDSVYRYRRAEGRIVMV